ncbi:tryptophan--tRNA ligase [Candidatus Wolfebacteria bacterium]|nr:tryptophan--tRNA ligase [Candidatus Wolfebacteria bacterium]
MTKPTLLSGVKPSGQLHVGNYLGAIKQFVDLQHKYNMYVMVADYHALNTVQSKEKMQQQTKELVAAYVAVGLDPKKVTIFKQSDIPQHTELTWIFNTITTMPYLMRAHAFKDAEAKNKDISVGTFDYPMLMASDILLYSPDVVPVGKDQKQHIEFARDTAQKFNNTYGETFTLPKELIPAEVAIIPGIDGQKMSKSYNNVIPLFGTDEDIDKAVMGIKTDSKEKGVALDPTTDITFKLHEHFSKKQIEELRERYLKGSIGYKESKEILATNIKELVGPMRETYTALLNNPNKIKKILDKGAKRAGKVAAAKMKEVKRAIGVTQ